MSRWDEDGFFWKDERTQGRAAGASLLNRAKPSCPETGWTPPSSFPRLDAAEAIGLDIETCDPTIKELGPGARRGGFIAGISVATIDQSWYFPLRHEDGGNMDYEMVKRWFNDELSRAGQLKVGANLSYDLDFLWTNGFQVKGPFYDVLVAEPLINEWEFKYDLDSAARKYLGEQKKDDLLNRWCADAFGGRAERHDQVGNYWRAPPKLVGPYAEADAQLPLRIMVEQRKELRAQQLERLFGVESDLMPLLVRMRMRGVRVAAEKADLVLAALNQRAAAAAAAIPGVDAWSADSIAAAATKRGLKFPKTKHGAPSFRRQWLEKQADPLFKNVVEVRRLSKTAGTFVQGYLVDHNVAGRVHATFNQLKGDDTGARPGRLSSSDPNLQNIPARDPELGPLIRGLFLPDEGEDWGCADWSQIEYRLLTHYGEGPSAEAARYEYRTNPETDFHEYVASVTQLERGPAKNINFGLVYGMGKPALAANLNRTLEQAEPIFEAYHAKFPFVKELSKKVTKVASKRGHIVTLLGRHQRFVFWEPRDWDEAKKPENSARPYDQAVEKWGERNIRRAGTNKSLNNLLQGGAADLMKLAMVEIDKAGLCDVLGVPLITVHDELDWSVPRTPEGREAFAESIRIMETCFPLKVPLLVTHSTAASWGEAK